MRWMDISTVVHFGVIMIGAGDSIDGVVGVGVVLFVTCVVADVAGI